MMRKTICAIYTRPDCLGDKERERRIKTRIRSCVKYADLKNFVVDSTHIYVDTETFGTQPDWKGWKKLLHDERAMCRFGRRFVEAVEKYNPPVFANPEIKRSGSLRSFSNRWCRSKQ